MKRVAALAEAHTVAPPSPELCLIAGMIIHLTHGKPRRVERMVAGIRDFTAAQKELSGVVRIRGSEYDEEVMVAMSRASEWIARMEPFLLMMARR